MNRGFPLLAILATHHFLPGVICSPLVTRLPRASRGHLLKPAPSPPRAAASPSLKSQRPHPLKNQMPKGALPGAMTSGEVRTHRWKVERKSQNPHTQTPRMGHPATGDERGIEIPSVWSLNQKDQLVNAQSAASTEPTKVDTAASESCTRSGVFALLLTVSLSLLIPYWAERRNEEALGKYISFRQSLANGIEMLDENPIWKDYKAFDKAAESKSISELKKVSKGAWKAKTQTKAPPVAKPRIQRPDPSRPTRPSPPSGLSVTTSGPDLDTMFQPITDLLNHLNDPELLNRSRKVSNFFEFSIVRWASKREQLMYKNMLGTMETPAGICFSGPYWEIPYKEQRVEHFVPALDRDALLNCLTPLDVRVLAQFELPTFSNPMQFKGSIYREVETNPNSLIPRDLYVASALAQLLLFFVIVHFGAFAREAVSSAGFPVQGTLFSAFSGSSGTLLVFFFALWSPLCVSLAVVFASRRWSLIPYTLLIGCASLFAYRVLQSKSFFDNLNPHLIRKFVTQRDHR